MKYDEYINTKELLSIQKTVSNGKKKDEITFIVVHQVSELLLKLLHLELDELERIDVKDIEGIICSFRKLNEILSGLIGQLRLCHYVPENVFFMIREKVYPATAQESDQFNNLFHRVNCTEESNSQNLCMKVREALENISDEIRKEKLSKEIQQFKRLMDSWQKQHIDLSQHFLGNLQGAVTSGVQYLKEKHRLSVFPES